MYSMLSHVTCHLILHVVHKVLYIITRCISWLSALHPVGPTVRWGAVIRIRAYHMRYEHSFLPKTHAHNSPNHNQGGYDAQLSL